MSMKKAVQSITNLFSTIVDEVKVSRGKIKKEDILTLLEEEDIQTRIEEEINKVVKEIVDEKVKKIKKANKPLKLKDPDAPKKPRSSYIIFCQEKRPEVKKRYPRMSGKEIIKKLGKLWKELDDDEKEEYKEKARDDRARYEEEMKDYIRPSDEELEELPCNKRRKRRRKSKSTRTGPKRPCSAYLYFCKDKRQEVKEKNPELNGVGVTIRLGALWKEMDDEDKKPYQELADKDKERYKMEMDELRSQSTSSSYSSSSEGKTTTKRDISQVFRKQEQVTVPQAKRSTRSTSRSSGTLNDDDYDELEQELFSSDSE